PVDRATLPSGPPRIAELSRWATDQNEVERLAWMEDFKLGLVGAVTAIRDPDGVADTEDAFLERWQTTAPSRRGFISFTSADHASAEQASAAFTSKGYTVFTFLNTDGSLRYDTAKRVGEMFATAGSHFVIDTPNARRSPGVWLEAKMMP